MPSRAHGQRDGCQDSPARHLLFFSRRGKSNTKACWQRDVIAGCKRGECSSAANGAAGEPQRFHLCFAFDEVTAGKAVFSLIHYLQILVKYRFSPITQAFNKLISF